MKKILCLIVLLSSITFSQQLKCVITTSNCTTSFWSGKDCFTMVKTIEKQPKIIKLDDKYGERGDTLIIERDFNTYNYPWKPIGIE